MADQMQAGVGGVHIAHQVISPDIYCNGVEVGLTLSDMSVNILMDGQRQCRLHMSFTTAKTFAEHLSEAVAQFEQLADHSIMTMSDVEKALKPITDKGVQGK